MTDAVGDHVRALYGKLKAGRAGHARAVAAAAAAATTSPSEDAGAAAVGALKHAYDTLDHVFQPLVRAGRIAEARQVKAAMDEIAAVSIAINRAVVAYLDGAADVAAAKRQVEAATTTLEAEAKHVADDLAGLGKVAAALDAITRLVKL